MRQLAVLALVGVLGTCVFLNLDRPDGESRDEMPAIEVCEPVREPIQSNTESSTAAPKVERTSAEVESSAVDPLSVLVKCTIAVLDAAGGAVSGARVECLEASNRPRTAPRVLTTLTTDARGEALWDSASFGDAWLRASHPAHGSITVRGMSATQRTRIQIELPAASKPSLRGKIMYASGLPAMDVAVSCAARMRNEDVVTPTRYSTIDSFGRFELAGLERGEYFVTLVKMKSNTVLCRRELEIGENGATFDLILRETVTVSGRVRSDDGLPVAATLWIEEAPRNPPYTMMLVRQSRPSDGTFRFDDVPPGEYVLEARAPNHEPKSKNIRVGSESMLDLELTLVRGGTIRGVVSSGDEVVPEAVIQVSALIEGIWEPVGQTNTDSQGKFEFGWAPFGRCRLDVASPTFAFGSMDDIYVSTDDRHIEVAVAVERGGRLEGSVANWTPEERNPRPSIKVESRAVGLRVLSVEIDERGRFALDRLPSGKSEFELRLPGREWIQRSAMIVDGETTHIEF